VFAAGAVLALAIVFVLSTPSCTGSPNTTLPPGGLQFGMDSNGGVAATDAGLLIFVPAGAIAQGQTVLLTISPDSSAPQPDNTDALVGQAYVLGPTGTSFAKSVTVIMPIDPTTLPDGKTIGDVVIFTTTDQGQSGDYSPMPTAPFANSYSVSALTDHFSRFVPAIPSQPINFGSGSTGGTGGSTGCSTTGGTGTTGC
jgi:hypothetical protein